MEFLKGFKRFLLRDSLLQLAVAFIMAQAFTQVVESLAENVISPLVGKLIGGEPDYSKWTPGGIPLGTFLTSLLSFLLLAAGVYFLIVAPYQKWKRMRGEAEAEGEGEFEEVSDETEVLREIRDLLAARGGGADRT